MASGQLTKALPASQPRSLWPFHATLTGGVCCDAAANGIPSQNVVWWKSNDLLAWAPVTDEVVEEMTQPVPGQQMEMVWNHIVSGSDGAFFRIEITWLAP